MTGHVKWLSKLKVFSTTKRSPFRWAFFIQLVKSQDLYIFVHQTNTIMKKLITTLAFILYCFFAMAQSSANASLTGRNVVGSLPRPSTDVAQGGTVVVQVKVDQYGNVTEAVPGVEGTTITNVDLWNASRNAAMKAHFNTKADAPVVQVGTITYVFPESAKSSESIIELRSLGYNHLRFKEVEITGNYQDFARKLEEKGCVITESSDIGVLLVGPFMGYPNVLMIVYPDQTTKDVVTVGAFIRSSDSWSSMESLFLNTVETYKKKYGDPQKYTTDFAKDLVDSEYFRKLFVEENKCNYSAVWYFDKGGILIKIQYMNNHYGVLVQYVDSQNSQKREENILDEI